MRAKFKIIFKYNGFLYLGDVHRQVKDGEFMYNIQYTHFADPSDLEIVHIYKGKGKDERLCWRQRADEADIELKDPAIIESIGQQIQIRENNDLK
jgi:hypothetical protein